MKKIYYFHPPDSQAPLLEFMEALDAKAQRKLEYTLKRISITPGRLSEPQVKHFSIERYRHLYELREKIRILIRIVFVLDEDGNVVLLCPFIKRHKRNTNQALESSLIMLAEIRENPDCLREYVFASNQEIERNRDINQ